MEYITLNNGVRMPHIGFGTIGQTGQLATDNVAFALNNGYELIDTANRYGNEVEVGEGLRASGLPRESYFLETKLGPTLYGNDGAVDGTLTRLGVDYIDLMILHHPVNDYVHAYRMLEKAYKEGKLRAIGISNFPVEKIAEIIDVCEVRPAVMQVEGHPYWPAEAVRPYCQEQGIALQTWWPLGHGNASLTSEPVVRQIAEAHGKSPVQAILRWHVQMGFCPVPGSKSFEHLRSNVDIFDFALTEDEMAAMATLSRHEPLYQQTPESLQRLATTKCNFEE